MQKFFEKKVDLRSNKQIIDFLTNHFRYYTMNPWNKVTSYANNIKLYNIDLNKELENKAYDAICDEDFTDELYENIYFSILHFKDKYGYDVGMNGRSNGYLVLYDTEIDENGITCTYPGRSIDQDAPECFEDWTNDMLKERIKIIQAFDALCDEIRNSFIEQLKIYES